MVNRGGKKENPRFILEPDFDTSNVGITFTYHSLYGSASMFLQGFMMAVLDSACRWKSFGEMYLSPKMERAHVYN